MNCIYYELCKVQYLKHCEGLFKPSKEIDTLDSIFNSSGVIM